ncbi:MAG TPA: hypothetical protein VIM69_08720 [Opitutaceae bacterium]
MSSSEKPATAQKLVTPLSLLVDAILCIAFFIYEYTVMSAHVPSYDKTNIAIWATLTALCLTGVFWLAVQMFRVVYRFQRENPRK